jgi:hypothetical protein
MLHQKLRQVVNNSPTKKESFEQLGAFTYALKAPS